MTFNGLPCKCHKLIRQTRIVFLAGPIDVKRINALMRKTELSLQYVIRRALYDSAVKEKVEA